MNKQTIQLPGNQGVWDSYISKYQPDSQKVLDNMFTANSKNFVTDQTGMIDKRQGGVIWNRTSFGGPAADSYEAIFESGARHYLRVGQGVLSASTGNGLFTTITSGYATFGNFEWATFQNRVYGDNGINAPEVYDTVTSYGGVSYPFTTGKTKVMGAQAPVSAPVANTPTSGGAIPVGPHRYEVTFMYYGSEESNGSPSSSVETTTSGNQTILLTSLPIGGYGVTARNIYRDNNDGVFLLLATVNDNTTTTYTDTLAQGSTPTPIPTDNGVPPTFSKIALWLDALWITPIGNTNTLLFSNAGSPDIFSANNFVICQSDDIITGLVVFNGTLYVYGLHSFGSIQGTTPDTFYYYNISNTIGCTDNRSIQIRSVVSVPTLWWLSDKGIYYSNGYTVEYGSDLIQDLVNLNLAQVNYSLGKNTQNSQAQYAGDIFTPGIDITSIPGTITTIPAEADYSTTADWLGGSVVTNLKTSDANLLEVPTQFAPTSGSGSFVGDGVFSGSNITISSTPPTNENYLGNGGVDQQIGEAWAAQPIDPARNGSRILSSISARLANVFGPSYSFTLNVYSDSLNQPSAILYTSGVFTTSSSSYTSFTANPNIMVTAGNRYWLVMHGISGAGAIDESSSLLFAGLGSERIKFSNDGSTWFNPTGGNGFSLAASYTVAGISDTSTWTSSVYDSGAISNLPANLIESGSYPGGTSVTTIVYASPNSNMSGSVNQVINNPSGSTVLTLTGYRYYQITVQLTTTDNRSVPIVTIPIVTFNITGTWISQPIDTTTDNTGWGTLTFTGNVPFGTTATLTIATSSNNITYSSFGPLSGALIQRWAKIQLVLTTTSDNVTSPSISDVTLTWNITATIESSPIDTGTTPAGFSTMQFVETNLSIGTVTMYLRTASTALGLSSATYVVVPNGTFPNLTPFEFVQWKLVLTTSNGEGPQITSITVNWFIGTGTQGVRCASLFYNKTYYLSVATIGSTFNNVLIQLDQFGKWRIQKDNSVGTLLLYFNTLYFSDGENGNIYNGFIAPTDNGTAITLDVRTKAWHEADDIFLKVPRGLKITGLHTGTFIHAYYSTDRGNTFVEMFNEMGAYGYQTTTSGQEFVTLFVPNADTLQPGRTLMFRIVSADVFPCSIINFEPTMYSRKGRYLNNG